MREWALILLASTVVGTFACVAFRAAFHPAKIRKLRFKDREPVDDELFYERYYGSSGFQKEIVIALRHELASAFEIESAKLLSTDRFDKELSVVRGWEYLDDASDELFLLNREREKRLGVRICLKDFGTVDDYIRQIAQHQSAAGQVGGALDSESPKNE